MAHSSSMTSGGQTFVDNPMGVCMHSEYGDRFDPMGGGCRHMNAWQKAYQGWYGACNGVKVASSGTFTLLPNGRACNGAQFLQIPAPKVRMMPRSGGGGSATVDMLTHYYIEFRAPDNFDGTLGWRNMPQAALAPQVQVRIGGDLHERTQRGLHTWLLDMTPATASNSDAGLLVGKTYTDPAGGLSVTVMAIDANQATVKVDIMGGAATGPTCIDGTPFTAPGPGPESCMAIPVDGAGGMGGTVGGTGGVSGSGGANGGGGRGGAGAGGRTDAGMPLPGSGGSMGTGGELGGLMPADGAAEVGGVVTGSGGSSGTDGPAMVPRATGGEAISGCGCETAPGGGVPTAFGTLGIVVALGAARRRRRG
jgi:MYXO-CTERM domain-containing protein